MADNMFDWKDEIGVEFDPPSGNPGVPLSSLSPCHSVDSGFDNEINFLPDFDNLDLDMILNVNASLPKQEFMPSGSKRPSTSTKVTKTSGKAIDEMSEQEKSNKNALAARENRLKKKKYVEDIEKELKALRRENEILKTKDRMHNQVVGKLKDEVSYLKNVLTNQSTLSVLMNRLVSTPGINFNLAPEGTDSPKLDKQIPDDDGDTENGTADDVSDDEDNYEPEPPTSQGNVPGPVQTRYQTRGTKRKAATEKVATDRKRARKDVKGGVCLHIGQDMVSVTFCSQCSRNVNGNTEN